MATMAGAGKRREGKGGERKGGRGERMMMMMIWALGRRNKDVIWRPWGEKGREDEERKKGRMGREGRARIELGRAGVAVRSLHSAHDALLHLALCRDSPCWQSSRSASG